MIYCVSSWVSSIRRNSIGHSNLMLLIHVDLDKGNPVGTRQLSGQLLVGWSDGLARSTPVCID